MRAEQKGVMAILVELVEVMVAEAMVGEVMEEVRVEKGVATAVEREERCFAIP